MALDTQSKTQNAEVKAVDETEAGCWIADGAVAEASGLPAIVEVEPEPAPAEPTKEERQAALMAQAAEWEKVQEQRKRELLGAKHGLLEAEGIIYRIELRHLQEDFARMEASLKPQLDKLRREHREPDASIYRLRSFPNFPGGLASLMADLGPAQSRLAQVEHRLAGVRRQLGLSDGAEKVTTDDC